MNKTRVTALILLSSITLNAEVITFNDGTLSNSIDGFYSDSGLYINNGVWKESNIWQGNSISEPGGEPQNVGPLVIGSSDGIKPSTDNPFVLNFTTPLESLGMQVSGLGGINISIYSLDGDVESLLSSYTYPSGSTSPISLYFNPPGASLLSKMTFEDVSNVGSTEFLIGALVLKHQVPEPSQYALTFTAMTLLSALIIRRKKSNKSQ